MKSRSFLEHRDTFTFRVTVNEKPFTRRVVLSTINGLYNPLGFALPVNIAGKLLLREAMNKPVEWDQPLPEEFRNKFQLWKHDIGSLEGVNIPRTYSMGATCSSTQMLLNWLSLQWLTLSLSTTAVSVISDLYLERPRWLLDHPSSRAVCCCSRNITL